MCDHRIKRWKPLGPTNLYAYFISGNPSTSFNPISRYPNIDTNSFIGPFSSVIGDVRIDKNVFVGCNAVLRADEGTPFYIGCNSNIQDGVILHGLKNEQFMVYGKADKLERVPESKEDFAKKVIKVNVELSAAYSLKFGDTRCSCGLCCNRDTLIHD
jgi:hypothetical protein